MPNISSFVKIADFSTARAYLEASVVEKIWYD
jgi:hypothetical protein